MIAVNEFKERRRKLLEKMEDFSVAVIFVKSSSSANFPRLCLIPFINESCEYAKYPPALDSLYS